MLKIATTAGLDTYHPLHATGSAQHRYNGDGGQLAVRSAPARDRTVNSIEVQERSAAKELIQAHATLTSRFPDEAFPRDFIVGSPRKRKLQTALLLALLAAAAVALAVAKISTTPVSSQLPTSVISDPRWPPWLAPTRAMIAGDQPC